MKKLNKYFILILSALFIFTACGKSSNDNVSKSDITRFDEKTWKVLLEVYDQDKSIIDSLYTDNKLEIYNSLNNISNELVKLKKQLLNTNSTLEKNYNDAVLKVIDNSDKLCNNLMEYLNTDEIQYLSKASTAYKDMISAYDDVKLKRTDLLKKAGLNEELINSSFKDINIADLNSKDEDLNSVLSSGKLPTDTSEVATDDLDDSDSTDTANYDDDYDDYDNSSNANNYNYTSSSDFSDIIGTTKTVQTHSANVRTGPGFAYGISYVLNKGASVYITDAVFADDRVWCKIGDGQWISINTLNGLIK